MIRFIDIRNLGTGSRFSFFDTVTMNYIEIGGEQSWNNWDEFLEISSLSDDLERFKRLCPDWVFDGGEDDIESFHQNGSTTEGRVWEKAVERAIYVYDGQPVENGKEVIDYLLAEVQSLLANVSNPLI